MISEKDVLYIAGLAKMNLESSEIRLLAADLESILGYIKQLETLDVSDVTPTSHVLPLKNVYRNDDVSSSLTQNDALSIAVSRKDGFFRVPQIID